MRFLLVTFVFSLFSAVGVSAQSASNDLWPFPDRKRRDDDSKIVEEMLSKQQTAREKKEYAILVERSETALNLSKEIEMAFEKNDQLSESDRLKLEEFEKLMSKIRDDLGGDDDGETTLADEEKGPPKDAREAFLRLKRSTETLVAEIKKSTRFSVSVLAIESSNTLIRLARFLRLKN